MSVDIHPVAGDLHKTQDRQTYLIKRWHPVAGVSDLALADVVAPTVSGAPLVNVNEVGGEFCQRRPPPNPRQTHKNKAATGDVKPFPDDLGNSIWAVWSQ